MVPKSLVNLILSRVLAPRADIPRTLRMPVRAGHRSHIGRTVTIPGLVREIRRLPNGSRGNHLNSPLLLIRTLVTKMPARRSPRLDRAARVSEAGLLSLLRC